MDWKIPLAGIALILLLCTFIVVIKERELRNEENNIKPPTEAQREFYNKVLPVKEKSKVVVYEEIFQVPSEWRVFPEHEGILKPYLQGSE